MQNGDKGLPIISLAGSGLLVKRLIIIEQLGIFCILIHFSIIETQLCKTATRLCQEKMSLGTFFSHKSQEALTFYGTPELAVLLSNKCLPIGQPIRNKRTKRVYTLFWL